MKIAVTGAHRVGKTTLIDQLVGALPEYSRKAEPYYELEERGYVFFEIPGPDDYKIQLEHSLEQLMTREDHVIFDRCPIDLLAYIQLTDEFESMDIPDLYERVRTVMNEIDLLVFLPIEKPDRIGCPESELPDLRIEVNELLHDWIWDFDIDTIEVTGSSSARRNRVMKHIAARLL